jgi:hypothetical protein
VAVGVEQFIVHPGDDLSAGGRWALHGGTALFLVGTAAVIMGTAGRWRAAWPWPIIAIPAVAGAGLASSLRPAVAMTLIGVIVVATVLAGIRAQRRGTLETTEV